MEITSINQNSFGQIKISQQKLCEVGRAIHEKNVKGERDFVSNFYNMWENCRNTHYVDLWVTDNDKVYLKIRKNGKQKEITTFQQFINKIFSGMQHAIIAEENRVRF